jgi:hypothetical protein
MEAVRVFAAALRCLKDYMIPRISDSWPDACGGEVTANDVCNHALCFIDRACLQSSFMLSTDLYFIDILGINCTGNLVTTRKGIYASRYQLPFLSWASSWCCCSNSCIMK